MVTIQCRGIHFTGIRAIIFDKDGTLEDSQAYLHSLGQKLTQLLDARIPGIGEPLAKEFGLYENNLDPTGLLAVASRQATEVTTATYVAETGRGWQESLTIVRQAFAEAEQAIGTMPSPLFIGTLEVLQSLSQAGLKLGILSADTTVRVRAFVVCHQLANYIQLQMGVDQGPSKPDPALFLQACQTLGVEPNTTLMVGDAQGDIDMARAGAAAGCIGISWSPAVPRDFQAADAVITQLNEIRVIPS